MQEHPNFRPRSTLRDLAPMGVDTPHVESMESYLWRLASAHDVSIRAVKTLVLKGSDPTVCMNRVATADTPCASNELIARRLPRLTLQPDSGRLGFGKLYETLVANRVLRAQWAWCPQCVGEMRQATLYWPLAWSLRAYSYCDRHVQPMRVNCPACDREITRSQEWHPAKSACPHCGGDANGDDQARRMANPGRREYAQAAVSACLGHFCAMASRIDRASLGDCVSGLRRAVSYAMELGTAETQEELGSLLGLTPLTFQRLIGHSGPRLSLCALARLSALTGFSMAGILHEPLWENTGIRVRPEDLRTVPLLHHRQPRNIKQLQDGARKALEDEGPHTLWKVAADLGVSVPRMHESIGKELLTELRSLTKERRALVAKQSFDELVRQVVEVCKRLRSEGRKFSCRRVCREMGRKWGSERFARAYARALEFNP